MEGFGSIVSKYSRIGMMLGLVASGILLYKLFFEDTNIIWLDWIISRKINM